MSRETMEQMGDEYAEILETVKRLLLLRQLDDHDKVTAILIIACGIRPRMVTKIIEETENNAMDRQKLLFNLAEQAIKTAKKAFEAAKG